MTHKPAPEKDTGQADPSQGHTPAGQDQTQPLDRLLALARSLAASHDPGEIRRLVEHQAEDLLGRGQAAMLVPEPDNGLIAPGSSDPAPDHVLDKARQALGSGCPETDISDRGATACAPLMAQDHPLGVLTITDASPQGFSARDLDMLASLAAMASPPLENARLYARLDSVMATIHELHQLNDVHAILDRILLEARRLANADAGSVFLVQEGRLSFSYVHNDTLFADSGGNRELYTELTLPMDRSSIVGYAAATGETLAIDDAYALPAGVPYSFNSSFDEKAGYRTVSILTLPLTTFAGRLLGVMQLINARDHEGSPVPFSHESRASVPMFASNAAVAIERGLMTREQVLRMIRMAELRDPAETGAHVLRVGAYSAEIYQRWAMNQGKDRQEIRRVRDLMGVASMLHDVGKVGISDAILKKPGKLTDEEFEIMQGHTIMGARLFPDRDSPLDAMCADIALGHHEKFNGKGYPGRVRDIFASDAQAGPPKQGEDIPLPARITALADVFDALSSRRVYKEAWNEQRVFNLIYEERGKHFDPEVVDAFFQIKDVIRAIQEKYSGQYQG